MSIILDGTTGVTFPNGVTMADGTSNPVTAAQGGTGISSVGTAGNVLFTTNGTSWSSTPKLTSIAPVTLSGSSTVITTSIPAWAKRITLLLNGIGSAGAVDWSIQIGTASGLETTGYDYASSTAAGGSLGGQSASATTAYIIRNNNSATPSTGFYTLTLMNSSTNTWLGNGQIVESFAPNGQINTSLGVKSLSGVLTRISMLCGASTWSSGTVSIIYE